ncbi:MAG: hypothetical protein IT262_14575 [Saprospiraceae bacterium]|nr:hypothetical protein [Saprospiraceae bacterium]
MDYICTWIYLDSPEESSEYPQVGKSSHLSDFQKVYWRCVAVFFALSKKNNPNAKHVLYSNQKADAFPVVDGLNLQTFLQEKNVEIVTIPLTWQTPEGYFGKWRNQFYIFDILQFIESQAISDQSAFLILDSDCVIHASLEQLFTEIRQQGLLVLPMPYGEDFDINGITRKDMQQIYTELDGKASGTLPLYYGGEVFAATLPVIRQINAMAPEIWNNMLERYRNRQIKFNEEAHFLSYCYHKIGKFGLIERFIKRIWTSPKYNNVQRDDAQLPIWHLPSEKTGGIALLFRYLASGDNRWMSSDLGGYVGVPKRKKYLDVKHFLKHTWLYKALIAGS